MSNAAKSKEQQTKNNEQRAKGSASRYTPPHTFHWESVQYFTVALFNNSLVKHIYCQSPFDIYQ